MAAYANDFAFMAPDERMTAYRYLAVKRRLSAVSNLAAIQSNDEQMAANCIFRIKPDCPDRPTKLPLTRHVNERQLIAFATGKADRQDCPTKQTFVRRREFSTLFQSARVNRQFPREHRTDFLIARARLSRHHRSISVQQCWRPP